MNKPVLDYERPSSQTGLRPTDGGVVSCLAALASVLVVVVAYPWGSMCLVALLPVVLTFFGFCVGLGGFVDGGRDLGLSILGAMANGFLLVIWLLAAMMGNAD